MKTSVQLRDSNLLEQAMASYLLDNQASQHKHKKVKINMECRRKLEIKSEERRLRRDILEFDFN